MQLVARQHYLATTSTAIFTEIVDAFDTEVREWEAFGETPEFAREDAAGYASRAFGFVDELRERFFMPWGVQVGHNSDEALALAPLMDRFLGLVERAATLCERHGADAHQPAGLAAIQAGNFQHFLLGDTDRAAALYNRATKDQREDYFARPEFAAIRIAWEARYRRPNVTAVHQVGMLGRRRQLAFQRLLALFKFGDPVAMDQFERELLRLIRREIPDFRPEEWALLQGHIPGTTLPHSRRLLGERIAAALRVPVTEMVGEQEVPNYTTMGVEERRGAWTGRFHVADPSAVAGRRILIIDDVVASGALLREMERTVLAAGAREVRSFVELDAEGDTAFELQSARYLMLRG
ncbi:MAG: phosphoribosyltransferase, partial [Chloroflexota bacterium]